MEVVLSLCFGSFAVDVSFGRVFLPKPSMDLTVEELISFLFRLWIFHLSLRCFEAPVQLHETGLFYHLSASLLPLTFQIYHPYCFNSLCLPSVNVTGSVSLESLYRCQIYVHAFNEQIGGMHSRFPRRFQTN